MKTPRLRHVSKGGPKAKYTGNMLNPDLHPHTHVSPDRVWDPSGYVSEASSSDKK